MFSSNRYQLGGFHALNKAVKQSDRDTEIPEMRSATHEEVRFLKMREREKMREMVRQMRPRIGMRAATNRWPSRVEMRMPLRMRMRSSADIKDPSIRHSAEYLPDEVEESEVRSSPEHLSAEHSSIDPFSIEYSPVEPSLVTLSPIQYSPNEYEPIERSSDRPHSNIHSQVEEMRG